jgi:hypothetical protein
LASVEILLTIMNRKVCERSDCTPTFMYCPDICLKGQRETTETGKIESASRDLNPDLRNTTQKCKFLDCDVQMSFKPRVRISISYFEYFGYNPV